MSDDTDFYAEAKDLNKAALALIEKVLQKHSAAILQEFFAQLDKRAEKRVTDEMVTRFLGWRLPADFCPDGCIVFVKPSISAWPIGTNLLTDPQARAMLAHVLGLSSGNGESQS